jgi:hypothetical protein
MRAGARTIVWVKDLCSRNHERLSFDISAPSGNLAAMNTVSERAEPD